MEYIEEKYIQFKKGKIEEIHKEIQNEWIIEWLENVIEREKSEENILLFLKQIIEIEEIKEKKTIGMKNSVILKDLLKMYNNLIHNCFIEMNQFQKVLRYLHCYWLFLQIDCKTIPFVVQLQL